MKLQRQLSNGSWADIAPERIEEFLTLCEKNNGVDAEGKITIAWRSIRTLTRNEVVSALAAGKQLRNDPKDWYSVCRDSDGIKPIVQKHIEMVKCSCGHTIPKSSVMAASMGGSCPECYDRMSD